MIIIIIIIMRNNDNEKRKKNEKKRKTITLKILYYNYVDTKSVEPMKCKGRDINV